MNHCNVLAHLALREKKVEPILRNTFWLAVLLSNMAVHYSLFKDSCFGIHIQLVVIDAEAQDIFLPFEAANCVELIGVMPSVEINSPLVQVRQDHNFVGLMNLTILYDVSKSVVETSLKWSTT